MRCFHAGVCDVHVESNSVTVNDQTAQDIKASRTSFQDIVDCLTPGGIIQFATERFSVDETIKIHKNVSITSIARKKTSFICNGQPVFDIRSTFPQAKLAERQVCRRATVDISDITIGECEVNSTEAPIVIDAGSNVTLRSAKFFRNTNDVGPSAIKVLDGSSIAIDDCEFRSNRGSLGTVFLSNASSLVVSTSSFLKNTATNPEAGGGVFLIQVIILSQPDISFRVHVMLMQSEKKQTTVVAGNASAFVKNDAVGDGGVFYVSGHGVSLTIEEDVHFRHNTAGRKGGAVFISRAAKLTIRDAFFNENKSNHTGGGGIFAEVCFFRCDA